MSWNPVLDLVIEIKREYTERFGLDTLVFSKWIERLNIERYNDIFSHIITNQHEEFLLLRYDLTKVPQDMWTNKDSLYRECRSVVLDLKKECVALATMRKFFNINEVEENSEENIRKEIANADNVEFTDKLDGSMQSARWYNGKVLMAGSMALDPEKSWRLKEGYGMLTDNHISMLKKYYNTTFTFEYISEKDPHVVNYNDKEDGLYLISMRGNDGYEYEYNMVDLVAKTYKIKYVEIENNTLDKVLELMKVYKSDAKEGWVMSINGRRIKLKCDDYVLMHNVLDRLSSNNVIIKSIADGTFDDILSKVPENHRSRVEEIGTKVRNYVTILGKASVYYYLKAPKDDKRSFMIYVNDIVPNKIKAYVRNLYNNVESNFLVNRSGRYIRMNEIEDVLDGRI